MLGHGGAAGAAAEIGFILVPLIIFAVLARVSKKRMEREQAEEAEAEEAEAEEAEAEEADEADGP